MHRNNAQYPALMRIGPRCRAVASFDALVGAAFGGGVNAYVCARDVDGDFDGLAARCAAADADFDVDGLTTLSPAALRACAASSAQARAAEAVCSDWERLAALGKDPTLNVIARYPHDTRGLPIAVDVHSFHADRAPIETDTWLCTYAGAPSEGLDNDAATAILDDDAVRAAVRAAAGDVDDDAFAAFVVDHSFDLHHRVHDPAGVFSFGQRALWKIAVQWPGAPVPPCLHRAPLPDGALRLLLIC